MLRLWTVAGALLFFAVLFFLIWNFFIKATAVLALVLIVGAGIWGWWEIRRRRKAIRTPQDG